MAPAPCHSPRGTGRIRPPLPSGRTWPWREDRRSEAFGRASHLSSVFLEDGERAVKDRLDPPQRRVLAVRAPRLNDNVGPSVASAVHHAVARVPAYALPVGGDDDVLPTK